MWNCPLCQTENSSMVCACGFDKSRDYESYPTFGRLSPGLPSISGLTAEEDTGPRTATVTCPNCGQSAVIREGDAFPTCSKCDASPLNPADQLWAHRLAFNSLLREKGPDAPIKLFYFADEIMSRYFQYATPVEAEALREKFSTLGKDPGSLGIELPDYMQSAFGAFADRAKWMIRDGEIGKNIFDEWNAQNREHLKKQNARVRSWGFRKVRGAWHFTPFRADDYLRHTQSTLFTDAMAAYNAEDFAAARKHFKTAEAQGNPYAAAHLGMMHHNGRGCEKDHEAAFDCFERGARAGCPLAAAWISEYYRMGHAVEKDKDFAAKLYAAVDPELKKMCDAGDADAQSFRGFNLVNGINMEKDEAAGVHLLELAHAQGHKGAAVQLASCYYYGDGVERNYDTAFRLLTEQSYPDSKRAQYLLGRCYYHGVGTGQDYDRAFRHFKRAAELGHGTAKGYLGDCYHYGKGTEVDHAEAAKWYHDAADNHKNTDAAHSLAFLYYKGQGVEKNKETALRYWTIAAEAGDEDAQFLLGFTYLYDKDITRDEKLGVKWLEQAAEQGVADAQYYLGVHYFKPDSTVDDETGFQWLMKAAAQDCTNALYAVGGCYLHGFGTERDPDKGIEYLVKASDTGHLEASRELADNYYLGIENYKGQKLYKNPSLAHKYAMLAVQDETDGKAQFRMATIIQYAFGNPAGAKEWYLRAANNGHTEAKLEICKLYIQNREELDVAYQVLRDEIKPDNIAKDKYAEALYWRSVCLENGYGCARNKRQAKELYNKAIEMGYVDTSKKKKRFGLF